MLKDYCVGDAPDPRNYFFTHDENGFYQTLKRRIAEKLKTVDHSVTQKSRLIHDVTLFMTLFAAVMMERSFGNDLMMIFWALVSAQSLAWLTNISHNFVHQADNWRMKTANLSLITWREFRIFHVLVGFIRKFDIGHLTIQNISICSPITCTQTLILTMKFQPTSLTGNGFL